MSVSRRKDGRWLVSYKLDGKWKQRAFRNETEARAFDGDWQAQESDNRITLGELAISFFQARPDYNQHTKDNIVSFLARGCGAFMRDKYADALSRADLETMRQCFYRRGVGNNTINKFQAYVRSMLAWGVDNQLLACNPWRDFKRLRIAKPVYNPQLEDFARLYNAAPEWLQWLMKTAFCLALRPGKVELLALTWSAFNWQRGCVIIRQGKSGKLKTVVPPAYYLAEARARFESDCANGYPYVVHRGNGKRVLSFSGVWEAACKLAGVKLRPYDMRHLAATTMLARGADLASVAAQLGHSSPAVTGAVYTHVMEGGQSIAANKLPEIGASK